MSSCWQAALLTPITLLMRIVWHLPSEKVSLKLLPPWHLIRYSFYAFGCSAADRHCTNMWIQVNYWLFSESVRGHQAPAVLMMMMILTNTERRRENVNRKLSTCICLRVMQTFYWWCYDVLFFMNSLLWRSVRPTLCCQSAYFPCPHASIRNFLFQLQW